MHERVNFQNFEAPNTTRWPFGNSESQKEVAGLSEFYIRTPTHWNVLPADIRASTSVEMFKSQLETYFYILALI